jgi:hypothetical protein
MKFNISREWLLKRAEAEDDAECSASGCTIPYHPSARKPRLYDRLTNYFRAMWKDYEERMYDKN